MASRNMVVTMGNGTFAQAEEVVNIVGRARPAGEGVRQDEPRTKTMPQPIHMRLKPVTAVSPVARV